MDFTPSDPTSCMQDVDRRHQNAQQNKRLHGYLGASKFAVGHMSFVQARPLFKALNNGISSQCLFVQNVAPLRGFDISRQRLAQFSSFFDSLCALRSRLQVPRSIQSDPAQASLNQEQVRRFKSSCRWALCRTSQSGEYSCRGCCTLRLIVRFGSPIWHLSRVYSSMQLVRPWCLEIWTELKMTGPHLYARKPGKMHPAALLCSAPLRCYFIAKNEASKQSLERSSYQCFNFS